MRAALIFSIVILAATAVADVPPCSAPISPSDIGEVRRAVRRVTEKPILVIMGVIEDTHAPGAVVGQAYTLDVTTGKRIPRYTRTDLVSVYMRYTDRSHVAVYAVRKVRGRWRVEEKSDWFL